MRLVIAIGMSLVAGIALGGSLVQGLHAQSSSKVLFITDISDITDPAGFTPVSGRSPEAAAARIQQLGGRYVARTEKITAVDGTPPKRMIIIAFDNMEKAQAYKNADSQKEIDAIRAKTTKSRVFMIEGM